MSNNNISLQTNPQFLKRINKELKEIREDPPINCSGGPVEGDLTKWMLIIVGECDTVYEGGIFRLQVDLSMDYPFKAPKVKFVTQIFHPNVSEDGLEISN